MKAAPHDIIQAWLSAPEGISASQWMMLLRLTISPATFPVLLKTDRREKTQVSRDVSRLHREGWVSLDSMEVEGRRRVVVSLTDKARAALTK